MLEILLNASKSKEYYLFYTDIERTASFHYGRVLSVNEKEIAIEMVSPRGEYDGILVISTSLVFRVEKDGLYEKKMKKLISLNSELPSFEIDDCDISLKVLQLSKSKQRIVSIELDNSGIYDIMGIICSADKNICCINVIDEYGQDDGIAYLDYKNITKIRFDSIDEQIVFMLWNTP